MADVNKVEAAPQKKVGFRFKNGKGTASVKGLNITVEDLKNDKIVKMLRKWEVFDLICEPA